MLSLLSKGVPTKLFKFFWLKIFSICHRCQRHRWSTLSCEYLREFSKKFETALMVYSGAWGKLIHEKNQKSKISCTVPLIYLKENTFSLIWDHDPCLHFWGFRLFSDSIKKKVKLLLLWISGLRSIERTSSSSIESNDTSTPSKKSRIKHDAYKYL